MKVNNLTQDARLNILRSIEKKAEEWKREGYSVKANLNGWSRPSRIEGLIPDLRGKRGDSIIIGTIETEDSIEEKRGEWEKFKSYAENKDNVSFRLYIASEGGGCRLHKVY